MAADFKVLQWKVANWPFPRYKSGIHQVRDLVNLLVCFALVHKESNFNENDIKPFLGNRG